MTADQLYWIAADLWMQNVTRYNDAILYYPELVSLSTWEWIGMVGVWEYLQRGLSENN